MAEKLIENVMVNILIPTYNSAHLLDRTMNSIRQQNFPMERIYITIVDSGSEDGTYEKALAYDKYHLGVYCLKEDKGRLMRTTEAIWQWERIEGMFTINLLLEPGDILYPHCLMRCSEVYVENRQYNPIFRVICETDVEKSDGTVIHQKKLWNQECYIDGDNQLFLYGDRGYQHNILTVGGILPILRNMNSGGVNERVWWNKSFVGGIHKKTLYLPEVLACIRERSYDDELEEILLRWAAVIGMLRIHKSRYESWEDKEFESKVIRNLALYALWRSFLSYQKGNDREAEDCFLIASVMDAQCRELQIYRWMKELIQNHSREYYYQIKDYFEKDQ